MGVRYLLLPPRVFLPKRQTRKRQMRILRDNSFEQPRQE